MENKKISLIAIVVFIVCVFAMFSVARYTNNNKAKLLYAQGLEFAAKNDYQNAYYNFSKISKISDLSDIAILRQAICAQTLGDKKTAYAKYRYLTVFSKDKNIAPLALYNCALINMEHKKYNAAYKKLLRLYKKYPHSDYKKAASYQIGVLLEKKDPQSAKNYFLEYLDYAPNGRYARKCIEHTENLKLFLDADEKYIVANSLYSLGEYSAAYKYVKEQKNSKSAFLSAKILEHSGSLQAAKAAYVVGLSICDEKVSPREIAAAVDKYFQLCADNASGAHSLLIKNAGKSAAYPAILFEYAKYLPKVARVKNYEIIFQKYPSSYWGAESLWNVFWYNYKNGYIAHARELALKHINTYQNTNSTPKIKYWYAKILLREKKIRQGKDALRELIKSEPDSYYSYVAQNLSGGKSTPLNTRKRGMLKDGISFSENDLNFIFHNDKNLVLLALLNDTEILKKLRLKDGFEQSYIAFKENNLSYSVFLAKKALAELEAKLEFSDARYKLVYPLAYTLQINNYSKTFTQNPYLMLALIREESTFNQKALSLAGAAGLMQLMPQTASSLGFGDVSTEKLYDADFNIKLGIKYFSNLVNLFDKNEMLAVLSYNGGPGNVSAWKNNIDHQDFDEFLEDIPYPETQNYIKKVFGSYWNYTKIYWFKNAK